MQRENLIVTLKELGFSGIEIKDLLLYTLNTKDRQEQMLSWILAHKENCSKETIHQKARDILCGFLAANPYNSAAKNMPAPKWEPPPVPKPRSAVVTSLVPTPPTSASAQKTKRPSNEDPFYARMQILAVKG